MSATATKGDFCLIVHGEASEVVEGHPLYKGWVDYAREVYGRAIDVAKERYGRRGGPDFTGYVEARRLYAQGGRGSGLS